MRPTDITIVCEVAHKSRLIKGILPGSLSICAGWRATHIGINKASNGLPPSLFLKLKDVFGKLLWGKRHLQFHNHMEVIIWINLMPSHNVRLARVRVQTINNRVIRLNLFIPYVAVAFDVVPTAAVALVGVGADDGFLALEAPPVLGIGKERMHTIGEADWLPKNSSCTFAFTHLTSAFRDGILPKIRVVSGIQIEPGNMGVLIDSWLGFFIQFIKDPIDADAGVIRPGHGHHQGAIHTHDAGTVLLPDG